MNEHDIARNAAAIRNLAGRLERLGYTGDCHTEAEHIAVNLLADGYRRIEPVPDLHGPSSTKAGREAARQIFEQTRKQQTGVSK
jgi:hypothetical protein